jgi:hypothetical protein
MPNYNYFAASTPSEFNVKEQYLMPNYNDKLSHLTVLWNVKEQYLMPNYNILALSLII